MIMMMCCFIYLLFVYVLQNIMMGTNQFDDNRVKPLSLVSYNSRGFSVNRKSIIYELCNLYDIVMLQEHWLLDSQLHHLQSFHGSFSCHAVSGVDASRNIITGRPYGGLAILWNKTLDNVVKIVECKCNRLVAIILKCVDVELLLINVYMPCDSGNTYSEYREVLDCVCTIINSYDVDMIIFGGDFNCDFKRSSPNMTLLSNFIDTEDLTNANNSCNSDIKCTYVNHFNGSCSTIDHFFVSENLVDCVVKLKTLDYGDNLSDHIPLSVKFNIPIERLSLKQNKGLTRGIAWKKVTEQDYLNYSHILKDRLCNVQVDNTLLHCNNFQCNEHTSVVNVYFNNIINSCLEAGEIAFPKCKEKVSHAQSISGWDELVKPHQEKAILWHKIWKDIGRPKSGLVADIMRKTRLKYHYAIRYAKKNVDSIRNNKLAENLLKSNIKDFWSEIKKIKGRNRNTVVSIDNVNDDVNISELFADKYKSLYNSVSYNVDDMNVILSQIDNTLSESNDLSDCVISCKDVENGIKHLKKHKADILSGLYSDHLIYGGHSLNVHLGLLLSAILVHGSAPDAMLYSAMVPIPKNYKKTLTDSDNYRAIAMGNVIGKLLDIIILQKYHCVLDSCELQFGFKDNSSTNMCTYMVKETVQYYLSNGNKQVYGAVLDATKAFDRVNYCKLFKILLDRKLPVCIVRLIIDLYTRQKMCVLWNGVKSSMFNVSNGVKQGGILSPILFCVYIDYILLQIKSSDIGCHVGRTYCGAFGYADDIILLCPSVSGLQKMLDVCYKHATEYDVKFNSSKSNTIIFSKCSNVETQLNVKLGDTPISTVTDIKHLGHYLTSNADDLKHISLLCSVFNSKANAVLSDFRNVHSYTRLSLLQSYCSSFYGAQLINLKSSGLKELATCWRKALRKALGLPYMTHKKLLLCISNTLPFEVMLMKRLCKFYFNCYKSDNPSLNFIYRNSMFQMYSTTCTNVKHISMYGDFSVDEFFRKSNSFAHLIGKIIKNCTSKFDPIVKSNAHVIQECILKRDGVLESCLSTSDVKYVIDNLCVL